MAVRRSRNRRAGSPSDVVVPSETVDGDFNGAPDLAGVEASQQWEASDVLDAMQGLESGDDDGLATWEAEVVARREVLIERMTEAQSVGLGELFETTALLTGPDDEGAPLVLDLDELQDRVARLDAALAALEAALARGGAAEPASARSGTAEADIAATGAAASANTDGRRIVRRSRAERLVGWGALALAVAGGVWLARGRRGASATRGSG